MGAPKGRIPWNKNLTKEIDNRLNGGRPKGTPCSEEQKELRRRLYKGRESWNKNIPASGNQLKALNKWRDLGKNPRWLNYTPLGERSSSWAFIRKKIIDRDGECMLCGDDGKDKETGNGWLCVHHIDWNKSNNNFYNLITLCRSCHSRIQTDKEFKKLFNDWLKLSRLKIVIPISKDGLEKIEFEFSIDGNSFSEGCKYNKNLFLLFERIANSFGTKFGCETIAMNEIKKWKEKRKCLSQQALG